MKVIKKRIIKGYREPIYDLKIKDNHNYFVTNSNILVHNSGKSYVIKKIKSGQLEPRIVNTDKFKEFFGEWRTEASFDRSKKLTTSQLALYLNSMLPLFIDATSSNVNAIIVRNNILESLGYDTAMVFVNVPLKTAIRRASQREREVPEEYVREVYEKFKKMKGFLRTKFPLFIEVKNDEGELTEKAIMNVFKKVSFFYTSPIRNPIGRENVRLMRENGWRYLTPNLYGESELKGIASGWFRSTKTSEEFDMKIREYMEKYTPPVKTEVEVDEGILVEEKILPADKNQITKALKAGRNTSFELKSYKEYTEDERDFDVTHASKKGMTVEFNLDFIDLQYFVQDFCDDQGWKTTSGSDRPINQFWMRIRK